MTPDTLNLGLAATSNSFHLTTVADITTVDMGNGGCGTAACVDPALIVHSDANDQTQYTHIAAWGIAAKSIKTLTESSATTFIRIPVASGAVTGGALDYCVFASDATNHQLRCAEIKYAVVNVAGTETCTILPAAATELTDLNAAAISSGTFTYTFGTSTAAANACDLTLNAVSSLTQTTLEIRYSVRQAGPGEPLRQ